MKTKEELNKLRNEVEILGNKLAELTDDELRDVAGGIALPEHSLGGHGIGYGSNSEGSDITISGDTVSAVGVGSGGGGGGAGAGGGSGAAMSN